MVTQKWRLKKKAHRAIFPYDAAKAGVSSLKLGSALSDDFSVSTMFRYHAQAFDLIIIRKRNLSSVYTDR